MTVRVIRLGPGECSDPETGARYFGALAFPAAGEHLARLDAVRGWVGAYLHEANRVDGCSEPFADHRLNEFVQLPRAWCKARVRTARRRLRDRSDAARAMRPWVRDWLNNPHSPVPGVRKFTQRQIALYLSENDIERSANFQERVWRPSRPVLHLAIAYDLFLSALGEGRTEYGLDLASTALVGELVAFAKQIKPLFLSDERSVASDEDLLDLVWIS